jgi:AcrR family transcriptional regulator
MSRNAPPAAEAVRGAAKELLAAHRDGGPYPTVSGLARRFNVNRTTFYRHYADIIQAMLDAAEKQNAQTPRRRRPPLDKNKTDETMKRLRRENNDLRKHVEIYEEHIRMLTTENKQLREEIEIATNVARLAERRRPKPG